MPLAPGTRLGPYEITAQIGEGGMGEVYRATDTSLKRQVAIKVLPRSLADDPERLARFQREAEVLAAVNHPNIAAIHGLDRSDGHTALVMEIVEGPTLAERIAQGALPLDEALGVATQIADALEAAHERGIVHRDLKPANIKVRPDGTVKVLDFGLAKAADPVATGAGGLVTLATITSPAMTQVGIILGTAAYMSPEQARGRAVDRRTDIWAFGCVLFEMVAGMRPFDGEDVAEVLGAVIHKEVDWVRLPVSTPPHVRLVLERCLQKDPKQRFRDVGDVRLALAGAFATAAPFSPASARRGRTVAFAVAAIVLAAAAGAVAAWRARTPTRPATVAFTVDAPRASDLASFALSPDGRYLAFTHDDRGVQKLWIRPLDSTEARPVAGTDQANTPFWAPDSRRVAFFTNSALKQVAVSGSVPQIIAETEGTVALGGSWNDRDVILFARAGAGIRRVPATGDAAPQPVTMRADGDTSHGWPVFLPGGEHFVYLKIGAGTESQSARQLMWRMLDSTTEHALRGITARAEFADGHLVFQNQGGALMAQRFDAAAGETIGSAFQVTGTVWAAVGATRTALSLSADGAIAYRSADGNRGMAQLFWVDRGGKELGPVGSIGDHRNLVMSRSGQHLAVNSPFDDEDVWVVDVTRGTTSRVTFNAATDSDPVFSPDGSSIAFYSTRADGGIYRKAASGAGMDELVAQTGLQAWPRDWSRNGRYILYQKSRDLWAVPLDGDRKPFAYIATPAEERDGRFSPDGRLVAYSSDETGRMQVFVQDFPGRGAKFQVSTAGGSEPRWRADGRELFYLDPAGRLMSVEVVHLPRFSLGVPAALFLTRVLDLPVPAQRRYAVSADGQRFVMNRPTGEGGIAPITVIVNWQTALRNR